MHTQKTVPKNYYLQTATHCMHCNQHYIFSLEFKGVTWVYLSGGARLLCSNNHWDLSGSRQQSLFVTLTSWQVSGETVSVLSLLWDPGLREQPPFLPVLNYSQSPSDVLMPWFLQASSGSKCHLLQVVNVISVHISLANARYTVTPNSSGKRNKFIMSWAGKLEIFMSKHMDYWTNSTCLRLTLKLVRTSACDYPTQIGFLRWFLTPSLSTYDWGWPVIMSGRNSVRILWIE